VVPIIITFFVFFLFFVCATHPSVLALIIYHILFYIVLFYLFNVNSILRYVILCGVMVILLHINIYYSIIYELYSVDMIRELLIVSSTCYFLSLFLSMLVLFNTHKYVMYFSIHRGNAFVERVLRLALVIFLFLLNCSYLFVEFYIYGNANGILLLNTALNFLGISSANLDTVASLLCYEYIFMLFIYMRVLYSIFVIYNPGFSLCGYLDLLLTVLRYSIVRTGSNDLHIFRYFYSVSPFLSTVFVFFCIRYCLFEGILGRAPPYYLLSLFVVVVLVDRLFIISYYRTCVCIYLVITMVCFGIISYSYGVTNIMCEYAIGVPFFGVHAVKSRLVELSKLAIPISGMGENGRDTFLTEAIYLDICSTYSRYYSNLYFSLVRFLIFVKLKYYGKIPDYIYAALSNLYVAEFDASETFDIYSMEYTLFCGLKLNCSNYVEMVYSNNAMYSEWLASLSSRYIEVVLGEAVNNFSPYDTTMGNVLNKIYVLCICYILPRHMSFSISAGFGTFVNETLSYLTGAYMSSFYKKVFGIVNQSRFKVTKNTSIRFLIGEGFSVRYFKEKSRSLLFSVQEVNFFLDNNISGYMCDGNVTFIDYLIYIEDFICSNIVSKQNQLALIHKLCIESNVDFYTPGYNFAMVNELVRNHFIEFFNVSYGSYTIFCEIITIYIVMIYRTVGSDMDNLIEILGPVSLVFVTDFIDFINLEFTGSRGLV